MANAKGTRGQIIGQVFVFILAGLVFILIIAYGYKAIQYFIERQEQVVLVDFRTDLQSTIEGVKRDYGTVRKAEFKLPSKYQGVCFLDPVTCSTEIPELEIGDQKIKIPWAQESCEVKSANAFIVPRTLDLYLPDIQVDGYLCIPNTGNIAIKLEGTGSKAKISRWQ